MRRLPHHPILDEMVRTAEAISERSLSDFHKIALDAERASKARAIKAALTPLVHELLRQLRPEGDWVQKQPNLRIHCPGGVNSIPFHSDVLYGHSPNEINYWLALTPAFESNSLWVISERDTDELHHQLRCGLSLAEFEASCRVKAEPVNADGPGLYSFCCAQLHGSLPNETDSTRISLDFRVLPAGAKEGQKRRGAYFEPLWLDRNTRSPYGGVVAAWPEQAVVTIASLDCGIPAVYQRQQMQRFYPQSGNRELVEFYNLGQTCPTLADAMSKGPAIAFTVQQLKGKIKLKYAIGFADEGVWFGPGDESLLERYRAEIQNAPQESM